MTKMPSSSRPLLKSPQSVSWGTEHRAQEMTPKLPIVDNAALRYQRDPKNQALGGSSKQPGRRRGCHQTNRSDPYAPRIPTIIKLVERYITGDCVLTLQISALGYGSVIPLRNAAELSSSIPPYEAMKSKFRKILLQTPGQVVKLRSMSSLFRRIKSKCPTTSGLSCFNISSCASK